MATHLRDDTSARDAADTCDEIAAGLEADAETAALAPTWNSLRDRGDALATSVRDAKRATGRARAREKVTDSGWDRHNLAFGRAALDASHGKRDQAPYASFYSAAAASTANAWGIDREVEFGRSVVRLLATEVGTALRGAWAAVWETKTEALATASRIKKDAVMLESTQSALATLYIEDVNRELDRLEGELLRLFPGDRDTVDAFLSATRRTPKKKKNDEA